MNQLFLLKQLIAYKQQTHDMYLVQVIVHFQEWHHQFLIKSEALFDTLFSLQCNRSHKHYCEHDLEVLVPNALDQ